MKSFFKNIKRESLQCVWEPRGNWYNEPGLIAEVCEECRLIHCVDPFRNQPLAFGEQGVARHGGLHGFGKPGMYRHSFSDEELQRL